MPEYVNGNLIFLYDGKTYLVFGEKGLFSEQSDGRLEVVGIDYLAIEERNTPGFNTR